MSLAGTDVAPETRRMPKRGIQSAEKYQKLLQVNQSRSSEAYGKEARWLSGARYL